MNILAQLQADYQRFPREQSYELYDPQVRFQDPMTQFQGRDTYRRMIDWMAYWFKNIQMDLHDIQQYQGEITTRWTLSWDAPLPWQPRIRVEGHSVLHLNGQGLIDSHVDHWAISRWQLLLQHFGGRP